MNIETMDYDVVIVGAGPAGLAGAIKLKQLAQQEEKEFSVCIVEKASEIGGHSLSGAILDPKSLKELLTNWEQAPLDTAVKEDKFYFLTQNKSYRLPTPNSMRNEGNYIISLGQLCRWLAAQAEALDVDIIPGFAATKILFDESNKVIGIATGDFGIDKEGLETHNYQPGMHIMANQTLLAEGCRGQLSQQMIKHYKLTANSQPQSYGLGIKEMWQIPQAQHQAGLAIHTVGWPMDKTTYGGSFLYHLSDNQVAVGFVVGLDYDNPWLSPFDEMQRFKTHPFIKQTLQGGERISYGARALIEGGLQCLPKLTFPGGALIGDSAGFLNVAKIKGIHTAIKSGMLAAEAAFKETEKSEISSYPQSFKNSWLHDELYRIRNIRPGFHHGLLFGLAYAALDSYILRGRAPWTFKYKGDHFLKTKSQVKKITYPKPDNQLTFDKLSSVYLAGTFHEENQPCHLKLIKPNYAIDVNYELYRSPEQRYCPAGVYEIIQEESGPRLQINAQNCIHCKTCDIKDPMQNILWTAPEGGGGPSYGAM